MLLPDIFAVAWSNLTLPYGEQYSFFHFSCVFYPDLWLCFAKFAKLLFTSRVISGQYLLPLTAHFEVSHLLHEPTTFIEPRLIEGVKTDDLVNFCIHMVLN